MNKLLYVVWLGSFLAAACAAQVDPAPQPGEPEGGLTELEGSDILLQLDFEPTFSTPQLIQEFGRVPPFTLFADGTLIYVEEGEFFSEQRVMQVQLTPFEVSALLGQVLAMGFERLESYLEMCQDVGGGESLCIADDSFTILRGRLPDGSLKEVKIYSDFSEDPAAFAKIRSTLAEYSNPEAEAYVPSTATLFVEPLIGSAGSGLEWPLGSEWLSTDASSGFPAARVISGEPLQTLLEALPQPGRMFEVQSDGQIFSVELVPWLPHADHTELLPDYPGYIPGP